MDRARKELANCLFALATELIEDTHELAVRGQSRRRKSDEFRAYAVALEELSQSLSAISVTITTLIASPASRVRREH